MRIAIVSRRLCLVLSLFGAWPSPAAAVTPADAALEAWRAELPQLRLSEPDLAVSTAGLPLAYTVGPIESGFAAPLVFISSASAWSDRIESAEQITPLFDLADEILGGAPRLARFADTWAAPVDLPAPLRTAVTRLSAAILGAQPYVSRAASSVSPAERDLFASLYDWGVAGALAEEYSSRRIRRKLAAMSRFRETDLRSAARMVYSAVDESAALLTVRGLEVKKRTRFKSPAGDVLIGGTGDDAYDRADLKGVAILIDLGGKNVYTAAPAAAGPGEIRVVIDAGSVTIRTNPKTAGGPASAFFGLSAFVLTSSSATHDIETGGYALGGALGGAAAFRSAGACRLKTGRYSQGAAVFGVGLFSAAGENASYLSTGFGQGAGFVRGVGIFRHHGDGASVKGGLVDPDPREPLGAVSMCQGVGSGVRAYAGGGMGFCILKGDRLSTLASYFAAGSGYWHGAGVFRLRGNAATIQARRYSLGAGVHTAFGHFEALGDDIRLLNWGVGPAYGWDRGLGSAVAAGDRLEVQADWGVGTAQIGGRSFGHFSGADNRFKAPEAGGGLFLRNESAYSLQIYRGARGRFESFGALPEPAAGRVVRNAWGIAAIEDGRFEKSLGLTPPVWPKLERDESRERQKLDLNRELESTQALPAPESVASLVDLASAFSLDKSAPREALIRLLRLPPAQAPLLEQALDPCAIDQLIQLSIVIPAHGDAGARALLAAPADADRGPLITQFLRFHRPTMVLPEVERRLSSDDARIAASAARAAGSLLNGDTGAEPGTRAALSALREAMSGDPKRRAAAETMIARIRFPEAMGLLAMAADLGAGERIEFLTAAPEDLTDKLGETGAKKLVEIVSRYPGNAGRIDGELRAMDEAAPRLRKELAAMASRSDRPGVVTMAIAAAGQIGDAKDAGWIEKHLDDKPAAARETAAVALARLGKGGLPSLKRASRSKSPRVRAMAAFATAHAIHRDAADILASLLSDPDPVVSLTAAGVLESLPPALESERESLKKKAARILKDASRDVQLNLKLN